MNGQIEESEGTFHLGEYFTKGIRFHELARAIENARPMDLLVMGCGNGYLESILPDSISILSVDTSPKRLEVARILNRRKANREFRLLDLYDLPEVVEPGSFDGVVISEVIEHLEDDQAALQIAHECLRPEGPLFFTVPNLWRFRTDGEGRFT